MDIEKLQHKPFFSKIVTDLLAGIKHGFFKYEIECEITQGKKRQLTFKAGKNHKFTIPEDELKDL